MNKSQIAKNAGGIDQPMSTPSNPQDVLGRLTDPIVQPDPHAYGYKGHPGGGGIQDLRYFRVQATRHDVVVHVTDHERTPETRLAFTPTEAHRLIDALRAGLDKLDGKARPVDNWTCPTCGTPGKDQPAEEIDD